MKRPLVLATLLVVAGCQSAGPLSPPVAMKEPHSTTLFGDTRVDNYNWLREKESPATLAYLKAENAYTDFVMKPTAGLQDRLFHEILSHIKEDDKGVPYRKGNYMYYSRTEEGKQYDIMCRTGVRDTREQVTLDVNELAKGQPFMDVGEYDISPDGGLLATPPTSPAFANTRCTSRTSRPASCLRTRPIISPAPPGPPTTRLFSMSRRMNPNALTASTAMCWGGVR